MAQTTEGVSESVEEVRFSFMTDEEVRRHSVVKITNPILLDTLNNPVPGGLYDPLMGPHEDNRSLCKTCGQTQYPCFGHCGHIDLFTPVFNPLLFNMVYKILQRTCFYCRHFRANRVQVEKCVTQLRLIAIGDVIGAKKLDSVLPSDSVDPADSDGSHVSTLHIDEHTHRSGLNQSWTSLQLTEALSILNEFLKPKFSKCKNCDAKNPKITKPTFGWIHKKGVSAEEDRANVIRGRKLGSSNSDEDGDKSFPEVVNADDRDTMPSRSSMQNKNMSKPFRPSEVKEIMKFLWENEASLCSFICDIQQQRINVSGNKAGYSMFFLEAILVPPTKFRPSTRGGGDSAVMENPQTVLLNKVLESNIALINAYSNASERSRIVSRIMELQQSVNVLFDTKTAMAQGQKELVGICQLLEKKEGIFRQKMMGKRVNYACRSVISPDPYLAVNEIGVPPYFALRLTYGERVNSYNAANLRNAIVNGPDIHPGANKYIASKAQPVAFKPGDKKSRVAIARKLTSSRGALTQNGSSGDFDYEGKIVHRHLRDGDIVLVNRQPTLHKPSIMAHVVRVLKGEKTLRMHYANCSSYNADFDGDEMNVHLPQDEISRAEGYNIVNANHQYIVPTRGDTVRGLIQDHIVSGVILMLKDTFLTRYRFYQILYCSGVFTPGSGSSFGNRKNVSVLNCKDHLHPILPAILRPEPLWTGKQIISALLNHLTRDSPPFTLEKEGKIPASYFGIHEPKGSKGVGNDENILLIRKNELVHGVIDKAQYGKYGLVHTVQELYGADTAGLLLSALSRVFTTFLQTHGFTCGMDDLMIKPVYDIKRKKELEDEDVGEEVHCNFVKHKPGTIGPMKLHLEVEKAIHEGGQSAISLLDLKMKNRLHDKTSAVNKDLLLKGILKPFPENCISLMTISGAKGSTVNFQQISSCLGQQELEGKRVPRMVSGKTLPCFPPWDYSSRGGGFISDRFLTGLRPQEYYFHCMAGREGLVDTAVKTSRSGYLQRCLVKNLESLKVCYDYTVRDADGSIIQFTYGDDGVDVHQTSFITQFKSLAMNQEVIDRKFHHQFEFNNYISELPEGLERKAKRFIKEMKKNKTSFGLTKPEDLMKLVTQKYISSLAHSGEPVGVIAAQSIGEPSTQMTLNTFHHAGRGEMNVTLGIPRLQEILMTASDVIKTPIMTCPLLEGKSKKDAEKLVRKMRKVTVAYIIETMEVSVVPVSIDNTEIVRIYKLKIKLRESQFYSLEDYEETMEFSFLRALEDAIQSHILKLPQIRGIQTVASNVRPISENDGNDDSFDGKRRDEDEDDDFGGNGDEGGDDLGNDAQKRKLQNTDENDYEDGQRDDEPGEGDSSEVDQGDDLDGDISDDDEVGPADVEDEQPEILPPEENNKSDKKKKSKESKEKTRKKTTKDYDRAVFVSAQGLDFEVHLRFTNEPHILLDQIAQKAAKKVLLKNSGKIDDCQAVKAGKNDQVLWKHEDDKSYNKKQNESTELWALKTAGVDFKSLWEMQNYLDVNRIYSNNIHAILHTYGIEAAREVILREVKHVFQSYGVEIDYRHLSLITNYMTFSGGYQPMSRHGGVASSVSPFLKMSFETASKFIVESAAYGLADNLETPSSRICLGLPVKMGTGCFDIMQKVDI